MVTKLGGPLRREISINGISHIVTISLDGLKLLEKGRRKGYELSRKDLVSGDAALAVALNAAVRTAPPPRNVQNGVRRRLRAKPRGKTR
jgi:hypothetical protein